jgi:tellurite resistance protein TerB
MTAVQYKTDPHHAFVILGPYKNPMNSTPPESWHTSHSESFLEKIMAGCAIIAFGDGKVTDDETEHMLRLIRRFEPLRCYDVEHIEYAFSRACAEFEHDHVFAEDEALASLGPLRNDPIAAHKLVETCCAIAAIDGHFNTAEQRAAKRICTTLGLDPQQFNLGLERKD